MPPNLSWVMVANGQQPTDSLGASHSVKSDRSSGAAARNRPGFTNELINPRLLADHDSGPPTNPGATALKANIRLARVRVMDRANLGRYKRLVREI